ncbi:Carotenoid isomerooxygenase [Chionoecetes opilio]|uniref:Carotenoid isomerooxygenase n=1 Tax=Chionoecetes opilio TaxID=41210 RepID=A0A8J4XYB0_CHIOP|nr:Carotenoid isomerooxygenase [Chionoecetes opilio]
MTENYFVLLEQPMTIDVKSMVANTIRDKPFIGGMEWMENKLIKIHLVNRQTGKEVKQKVKCEAFFFMHIINCFEQDNHVIIDVNGYGDTKFLHALHVKNIRVMIGGSKAKAHRQKDGTLILTPDNITDFSYEIPTLNSSFLRKKYKYSYGTKGDMKHTQERVIKYLHFSSLSLFGKVDLETREVRDWGENGMYGSVLCYLPRPGATAEDDGTIIGTLLHSDDKTKVTLIVLNAADMTELARATSPRPPTCLAHSTAASSLHSRVLEAT